MQIHAHLRFHDQCLAYTWSEHGLHMVYRVREQANGVVYTWSTLGPLGLPIVYDWSTLGLRLVYAWSTHGLRVCLFFMLLTRGSERVVDVFVRCFALF